MDAEAFAASHSAQLAAAGLPARLHGRLFEKLVQEARVHAGKLAVVALATSARARLPSAPLRSARLQAPAAAWVPAVLRPPRRPHARARGRVSAAAARRASPQPKSATAQVAGQRRSHAMHSSSGWRGQLAVCLRKPAWYSANMAGSPDSSSQSTMPKLKTSTLRSYFACLITSGAIQR